jgi:polyphosphate:AMP phosphotransferase
MDGSSRHIRVVAFGPRTPDETMRPIPWRYWRALPPKGRVGIFMNAWYTEALAARIRGDIDDNALNAALGSIRQHERMLTDEGVVLVKFWIHLSKSAQKERLRKLDRDKRTSWRVTREDWARYRLYSRSHDLWEHALRETSTGEAPWYVVEGEDERYRNATVGTILLGAMERLLGAESSPPPSRALAPTTPAVIDNVKLIRDLDLGKRLVRAAYERDLERYQGKLARATRHRRFARHSLVLVFEGADAAGKGGAIRRVTAALDARQYVTVPIAAPTDEERAHPYLWRFWRNVPPHGGIAIFDRSWYGRVLVERVEGLCSVSDWMRAYDEINRLEEDLTAAGAIVVKFWMHIGKAEQRRFRERELRSSASDHRRVGATASMARLRKTVCDMVDGPAPTRAMDARRSRRQAVRTREGAEDDRQATRGSDCPRLMASPSFADGIGRRGATIRESGVVAGRARADDLALPAAAPDCGLSARACRRTGR